MSSIRRSAPESRDAVKTGGLTVTWKDAKTFEYQHDGKRYRYDIAAKAATVIGEAPARAGAAGGGGRGGGQGAPERGRQFDSAESPDKKLRAFYSDRNLYWSMSRADARSRQSRPTAARRSASRYGTGSWVYGEELDQTHRDVVVARQHARSRYYRFDESKVPDYYLQMDQTQVQSTLDIEAYPKAGADNPVVDVLRLRRRREEDRRSVDVRDGKPFDERRRRPLRLRRRAGRRTAASC